MGSFVVPLYVLDYTTKTINAVLSPDALEGKEVEVDVYDRRDAGKKYTAIGRRIKGEDDTFLICVTLDSGPHEDSWNYTLLRESAGRSRKMKK
jgi:hypothetical protein